MDNQNLKEINLEGNDFEEEVFVKFCEDIKANTITKIIKKTPVLLFFVKKKLQVVTFVQKKHCNINT